MAINKFHINKHGAPAACRAKNGNCPLGGDSGNENHFNSKEEAQKHADKVNEEEYKLMPGVSEEKSDKIKLTPAQKIAKEKREQKERLTNALGAYWTESDGSPDTKMVKHCVNNVKYVELGDSFVEVCNSKPKIHNEILFDDEDAAPEITFENFYEYNKRMEMPKKFEPTGQSMLGGGNLKMANQFKERGNASLLTLTYQDAPYIRGEYENVSEKQREQINKEVEEVQENYKKRLKTYFDKNKENISTKGYWKNR